MRVGGYQSVSVFFNFFLSFVYSKPILAFVDAGEVTASAVRSYVTVERPTGGKQIKQAKHSSGIDPLYTCVFVCSILNT